MPGQGVSTFAELVRAKSGGEVIIEASYDAAKGIKSGDMIAAVQTRKVDAGDAFAGALAEKVPAVRRVFAALPGRLAGQGAQPQQDRAAGL